MNDQNSDAYEAPKAEELDTGGMPVATEAAAGGSQYTLRED